MLIHDLAHATKISAHAIRYYEKEGLLDERHVERQANGYRSYTESAIERLQLLRQARSSGFTIAEIKQLAKLYDTNALSPQEQKRFLDTKIKELDEKITFLQTMKKAFTRKITKLDGNMQ